VKTSALGCAIVMAGMIALVVAALIVLRFAD
jgi:hypothetical protein